MGLGSQLSQVQGGAGQAPAWWGELSNYPPGMHPDTITQKKWAIQQPFLASLIE